MTLPGRFLTLMMVALSTASACQPAASPAPAASPLESTQIGETPTPEATAFPSLPPVSNRAVVRLEIAGDIGPGPILAMVLYDDGALIDVRAQPRPTVRRLSASGLALVLQRLKGSGLFTSSHEIPFDPLPMGFTEFIITLTDAGAPIRVIANNQGSNAETKALVALAEGLLDAGRWLPPEAFADPESGAQPYRAATVRVTAETIPLAASAWINVAQSIQRIDWPMDVPPDQVGGPIAAGPDRPTLRCGTLDGLNAEAIRAALVSFAHDSADDPSGRTTGWYVWLPAPALLRLTLRPLLPDELVDCAVDGLPGPPTPALAPRLSLFALLSVSNGGVTPASGLELFAQAVRSSDGATIGHVAYFRDGTVLFDDPLPPAFGIGALQLTPAGVQRLHEALDASGLLRGTYSESVPDGAQPPHTYSIVTADLYLNGSDRGVDPKATRIARLARKLLDPVSWLPVSAWASDPRTIQQYRPASVHVQIYSQGGYPDPLPPLAGLRWPLSGSLETFGEADESLPGMAARVADLSVDDALVLLGALSSVGAPFSGEVAHSEYVLGTDEPGVAVHFEFSVEAGTGFETP